MASDNLAASKIGNRPQARLVECGVDVLKPHPAYVRHGLTVSAPQFSALAAKGSLTLSEPVVITHDRIIIDGYARVELARIQRVSALQCVEYQLTEAEALCWFLRRHRRSNGLNAYLRIVLALDLEPFFREKALSNQRVGGLAKGSSNLTEADRIDVRSQVASAAGTSVGSVSKVKRLLGTAHPDLLQALCRGEISIHRGWLWSKRQQTEQRSALIRYLNEKGLKATIRKLVSRQRSKKASNSPIRLADFVERLSGADWKKVGFVRVAVVKTAGRAVFITEELLRALESQEELPLKCDISSR